MKNTLKTGRDSERLRRRRKLSDELDKGGAAAFASERESAFNRRARWDCATFPTRRRDCGVSARAIDFDIVMRMAASCEIGKRLRASNRW